MDCSCRPRCRHGAGASRGLPHVASPLQAGPLSNPTLQVRTLKLRNNRGKVISFEITQRRSRDPHPGLGVSEVWDPSLI